MQASAARTPSATPGRPTPPGAVAVSLVAESRRALPRCSQEKAAAKAKKKKKKKPKVKAEL